MEERTTNCSCCKETFLYAVIAFLIGVIVGFFIAPIKEGMAIGCENGNNNTMTNTECLNREAKDQK